MNITITYYPFISLQQIKTGKEKNSLLKLRPVFIGGGYGF